MQPALLTTLIPAAFFHYLAGCSMGGREGRPYTPTPKPGCSTNRATEACLPAVPVSASQVVQGSRLQLIPSATDSSEMTPPAMGGEPSTCPRGTKAQSLRALTVGERWRDEPNVRLRLPSCIRLSLGLGFSLSLSLFSLSLSFLAFSLSLFALAFSFSL